MCTYNHLLYGTTQHSHNAICNAISVTQLYALYHKQKHSHMH